MSASTSNEYYCDLMMLGPDMVLACGRFRVDSTNSPDLIVDPRPNVAGTTVVYENTGKTFTITLPKVGGGWPQEMVSCIAKVSALAATDTGDVDYKVDSYDPATGAFVLFGSVANVASALTDNSEVHFQAVLRRGKILGQTV